MTNRNCNTFIFSVMGSMMGSTGHGTTILSYFEYSKFIPFNGISLINCTVHCLLNLNVRNEAQNIFGFTFAFGGQSDLQVRSARTRFLLGGVNVTAVSALVV